MNALRCDFCAHHCSIAEGERGKCGIRENRGGEIRSVYRWQILGPRLDPVEKKPLFHYYPGSPTFSIAQFGCNFTCPFCQNYHLMDPGMRTVDHYVRETPESLIKQWREAGRPAVAFTYSEPAVWQDTLHEFSALVRAEGGRCIVVSNGYYGTASLERMMDSAEAFNIDFKGSDEFYREYSGARQGPVLRTISELAASREHVLEVTTLLIEELHKRDEILRMAEQLAEAGVRVWHISLFHPAYKMKDSRPTSEIFASGIIEEISAKAGIPHLYLGNSRSGSWLDTVCPGCGKTLISRRGFGVGDTHINEGRCSSCGERIYGRFAR